MKYQSCRCTRASLLSRALLIWFFFSRSDLVEDAVELEGIRGTVHGLQHWIEGMQEEQKRARAARDLIRQKNKRGWGGRKHHDEIGETEVEIVLDGLSAWMRGWKDVEDEFRVRARGRRTRREQRQRQLLKT